MRGRIGEEKNAMALGAEPRSSIKAGGGYVGALQLADDVRRFYDELAPDYDAIYVDWDAAVARNGALGLPYLAEYPSFRQELRTEQSAVAST